MTPTIVAITLVAYLALLFAVAYLSGRGADNASFFTARRSSHWGVVAISMVGAAMTGVTFISVPGSVAVSHFSYMQMVLGFIVGYLVIAFVLIPLFYRLNVVSLYEYLAFRFGTNSHSAGAWVFFISKMLGASLRIFVVCTVLQSLLYDHFGVPFWVNAALMMFVVWLYTRRGGVQTVVWSDVLRTLLLVGSIALSIIFVVRSLGISPSEAVARISEHPYSQILFLDDIDDSRHLIKQFLAGLFMVIAITGLDQDLMQRVLSSRTAKESQRNMVISVLLQSVVIFMFLFLGVLLYIYAEGAGIVVERADNLFGAVATSSAMPLVVGVFFVLGLIASTYSSAGSALTALTTSFTVDILRGTSRYDEQRLGRLRRGVHLAMAVVMTLVVVGFELWSSDSAINTFYMVASYSYGPLLGLFLFGLLTRRSVRDRFVPVVVVAAPLLTFVVDYNSESWLGGYKFGFEVLLLNAAITFAGLFMLSLGKKR